MTRSAIGWTKAITISHWLLVLALAFWAVSLLRTYCEGFGCVGLGIAWFVWACSFAIAFLLGLLSTHRAKRLVGWQRWARVAAFAQAALGIVMLGVWAWAKMA